MVVSESGLGPRTERESGGAMAGELVVCALMLLGGG